jgi:hypothetical protein
VRDRGSAARHQDRRDEQRDGCGQQGKSAEHLSIVGQSVRRANNRDRKNGPPSSPVVKTGHPVLHVRFRSLPDCPVRQAPMAPEPLRTVSACSLPPHGSRWRFTMRRVPESTPPAGRNHRPGGRRIV